MMPGSVNGSGGLMEQTRFAPTGPGIGSPSRRPWTYERQDEIGTAHQPISGAPGSAPTVARIIAACGASGGKVCPCALFVRVTCIPFCCV